MIAAPVIFIAVMWLAFCAASITAAISAETDIRDDYGPGELKWVWVHVPGRARLLPAPVCPPMHYLPTVEASVVPLLYGRPPVEVVGRVAA